MPIASVNGVNICHEIDGPPDGPPLLLIGGLGVQMIDWMPHFVQPLIDAGFRLITFDNRDIGLSTTFDGAPGDPGVVLDALMAGKVPHVAYNLSDMAADAVALLDHLGIDQAHVLGVSLGGMIAQTVAIEHRERVLSLISVMSTTGAPDVGQPTPEALTALLSANATTDREAFIAQCLVNAAVWASPGHFDEVALRTLFANSWDRVGGPQAENGGRQMCATLDSAPRDDALRALDVPSLVIHGTADTLITDSGGTRTAECLGGELVLIDGLGHDIAVAMIDQIVEPIIAVVTANTPA